MGGSSLNPTQPVPPPGPVELPAETPVRARVRVRVPRRATRVGTETSVLLGSTLDDVDSAGVDAASSDGNDQRLLRDVPPHW